MFVAGDVLNHAIVNAVLNSMNIYPYTAGGVGLGVSINQKGAVFQGSQAGSHVHCCSGFSNSTLLIRQTNNFSHSAMVCYPK